MKISLFGGAFDPPHLGHQQVVQSMLDQKIVEEVWFVPVFKHPWAKMLHKEFLTSYEMRVEMLQILVDDINEKRASDQVKLAHFKDVSYTYNTLIYFSQKYPEHEFSWIMGSEYLQKFDKFLAIHPKLIGFKFYIYPRKNFDFNPLYDNMLALKNMEEVDISSTIVREMVGKGTDFSGFVLPEIKKYVIEKDLYQK